MARTTTARLRAFMTAQAGLAGPLAAFALVLIATGLGLWFGSLLPGVTVFSLYYPAILAASLAGGEAAATLAVILSLAAIGLFFRDAQPHGVTQAAFNLLLFLFTGGFVGLVGARLRQVLHRRRADIARLAEREARYSALFDGVSEGFSLIAPIWNEQGRAADFMILEANPALLAMVNIDGSVVGRLQSEFARDGYESYVDACERASRGARVHFEFYARSIGRWFDVRLTPISKNRIAQLIVDITERKAAESRQSEMFDELNHRVKNNLAAISAMLEMQARIAANPEVREHLAKAIDRIQAIADLHASLYSGSSNDQVDFSAYLQRLCERLSSTLLDGERVRLDVEVDPVMAPLDKAVTLGLIVNELVTNAAKHAYPAPATGAIRVRLRNTPTEILLVVSDDGVGLPETASSKGIGMRLVRSLVQQRWGELEVSGDKGASFTLRLRTDGAAVTDGP